MRKLFAATLLVASLSASASDGYVGWSELSFRVGSSKVHLTLTDDASRIESLTFSTDDSLIDIPKSAISSWGQPILNDVKLRSVCCSHLRSNGLVLEIPLLRLDRTGKATKRVWEIYISDGKFQKADWAQPPAQLPGHES